MCVQCVPRAEQSGEGCSNNKTQTLCGVKQLLSHTVEATMTITGIVHTSTFCLRVSVWRHSFIFVPSCVSVCVCVLWVCSDQVTCDVASPNS